MKKNAELTGDDDAPRLSNSSSISRSTVLNQPCANECECVWDSARVLVVAVEGEIHVKK